MPDNIAGSFEDLDLLVTEPNMTNTDENSCLELGHTDLNGSDIHTRGQRHAYFQTDRGTQILAKDQQSPVIANTNVAELRNQQATTGINIISKVEFEISWEQTVRAPQLKGESVVNHHTSVIKNHKMSELTPMLKSIPNISLSKKLVTTTNQDGSIFDALQIRTKVKESLNTQDQNTAQNIISADNNPASPNETNHCLNYYMGDTYEFKRKQISSETKNREIKLPKREEDGEEVQQAHSIMGQVNPSSAELNSFRKLGPKTNPVAKSTHLIPETRQQLGTTPQNGRFSWLDGEGSGAKGSIINLRNYRKKFLKLRRRKPRKAKNSIQPLATETVVEMTAKEAVLGQQTLVQLSEGHDITEIRILCSDGELRPRGDDDEAMLIFVDWERVALSKPGEGSPFNPVELYGNLLKSKIDGSIPGNRLLTADQAMLLVNIILGMGSPDAIIQFREIVKAFREELQVDTEFAPGAERYGRSALRLTAGPGIYPFDRFAELVLSIDFYRYLEKERLVHGEMLPVAARGVDHQLIQQLQLNLDPRRSRSIHLRKLRWQGSRLSKITSIYGDGILALIPFSGRFGDCLHEFLYMDDVLFKFFHEYMAKYPDQFLLKLSKILEPYVRKGMWGTLILPQLWLEVEGVLDELAASDRLDRLISMFSPIHAHIESFV